VWDLEENAGAIAGFGIASARPPVRQVEQHLDSLAYDIVTFVAANVGYESNPAGVVLLRRMVQTLGGRRTIRFFEARRHGHVGSMSIIAAKSAAFGSVVLEMGTVPAKATGGPRTSAQEHTPAT